MRKKRDSGEFSVSLETCVFYPCCSVAACCPCTGIHMFVKQI